MSHVPSLVTAWPDWWMPLVHHLGHSYFMVFPPLAAGMTVTKDYRHKWTSEFNDSLSSARKTAVFWYGLQSIWQPEANVIHTLDFHVVPSLSLCVCLFLILLSIESLYFMYLHSTMYYVSKECCLPDIIENLFLPTGRSEWGPVLLLPVKRVPHKWQAAVFTDALITFKGREWPNGWAPLSGSWCRGCLWASPNGVCVRQKAELQQGQCLAGRWQLLWHEITEPWGCWQFNQLSDRHPVMGSWRDSWTIFWRRFMVILRLAGMYLQSVKSVI